MSNAQTLAEWEDDVMGKMEWEGLLVFVGDNVTVGTVVDVALAWRWWMANREAE